MLHKQVSQTAAIILDQMDVQKRKISRPKNMVQRSSCVLIRLLYKEKGSASAKNGCMSSMLMLDQKRLRKKKHEETEMNCVLYRGTCKP